MTIPRHLSISSAKGRDIIVIPEIGLDSIEVLRNDPEIAGFVFSTTWSYEWGLIVGHLLRLILHSPNCITESEVYHSCAEREFEATTASAGFAFPHTRTRHVEHSRAGVARLESGLMCEYKSIDSKPVSIVALVLSPESNPDEHMCIMEDLFELLRFLGSRRHREIENSDFCEVIRRAL